MKWEIFKKTLCIAHRGDTQIGVENTLPAIESALKLGVDGIEVDLQITRDGRVILFHDDDLRRLADRPQSIGDLDLADIRSVRLQKEGTIPSLEELLDLVRDRCLLNLEVKTKPHWYTPGDGRLEAATALALRKFGLEESILISSFHPFPLWRMRRQNPRLKRGVLFEHAYGAHRLVMPLTAPFSINAPLMRTTAALVKAVHDAKRRFLVWTVNDENDMKRCLEIGVDGIITDEARRLKELLQRPSGG